MSFDIHFPRRFRQPTNINSLFFSSLLSRYLLRRGILFSVGAVRGLLARALVFASKGKDAVCLEIESLSGAFNHCVIPTLREPAKSVWARVIFSLVYSRRLSNSPFADTFHLTV